MRIEYLLEKNMRKKDAHESILTPKCRPTDAQGVPKGSKSYPPGHHFFGIVLCFFKTHRPRASPTPPGRLPSAPAGPFLASKPTKICRELMKNITTAEALLIILVLVIGCQKNPMTTYTHTHKQTHAHTYTHTHTHLHTHTDTHLL